MPGKVVPPLQRTQAATGSTVMRIVELPEEVNAQDGPLHIRCDESDVALVHGRLAVLKVKCEGSLRTGGDGCAVGGGEQATLRRRWAGN